MPPQPPLVIEQVAAQARVGGESSRQGSRHRGSAHVQLGDIEVALQVGGETEVRHE
ncbi:hypothetical protein D3C78_1914750 [compost metagenome]